MRAAFLFVLACLAVSTFAPAAGNASPSESPTDHVLGKTCTAPVFRQFDFWLGHWTVTNPKGTVVGHSRISRISQGCAVLEQWRGRQSTGNSLNYYDAATKQWHQDWVGGGGQVLHLHGAREGKAMVLHGTRTDKQGTVLDRITWTPLEHGRVSQHWEVSRDDGATWKTLFLGTYAPEPSPGAH